MTGQRPAFDVAVQRTGAGARIVVRGDMDIASVRRLDQALEQAASDSPTDVALDLSAVGFVDSSGLKFLLRATARARSEGWSLTIMRPAETAIKALMITGVIDRLPFVDSGPMPIAQRPVEDDLAAGSEAERMLRLAIPSTLMAPRTARGALRDLIADHPLAGPQIDKLTLLVSEIVTNAVTHSQLEEEAEVEFTVTVTPELTRVLVSDAGPGFEWPGDGLPAGRVGGGYGIMLLDGQASRWGTHRMPGRFTVWFEIDHVREAIAADPERPASSAQLTQS